MNIHRLSYPLQSSNQAQPLAIEAERAWPHSLAESARPDLLTQKSASDAPSPFRSVLVPLDGTAHGERALPLAASIARRAGARLRLLHVYVPLQANIYPTQYLTAADVDRDRYRERRHYLRSVARQVSEAAGITVVPECVRHGDVVEGIGEAAARDVDLVVTSTHGYGWLQRVWQGSAMHRLIQELVPPMLILRGNGLRASLAPDRWLRRVLVPLDGSPRAEEALNPAMALGSLYEADYSLLTVVPKNRQGWFASKSGRNGDKQHAARKYLQQTVQRVAQRAEEPVAHVAITEASVAQAIVARAEKSGVDCIAMASGAVRGAGLWLHAGVTQRVVQLSPVPILVLGQNCSGLRGNEA